MAYSANEAFIKRELVVYLGRFIEENLRKKQVTAELDCVAAVLNEIQNDLANNFRNGALDKVQDSEIRAKLLTQFYDDYDKNCALFFREKIEPALVTFWKEEEAVVASRYGRVSEYIIPLPDVAGALRMAWVNLRRAQQRWATWQSLGSMLFMSNGQKDRTGFDKVARILVNDIHQMEKRMLMFALLSGGADVENARDWLKKTKFNDGMAVMNYLEYDGYLPGSWACADEDSFRDSILNS